MKLLNKLSLRVRMTLLTGLIVFASSLLLTLTSMYNAGNKFVSMNLIKESIDVVSAETLSETLTIPDNAAPKTALKKEDMQESSVIVSVPSGKEGADSVPMQAVEMSIRVLPTPLLKAKKAFDGWSYFYLFLISVVGMGAAYIISGRALRPVQELNSTVLRITGKTLSERIPDNGSSDEIASLSRSFNGMLDRLEQSFLRQKQFSANVAHELKTPLATMNAGIQVLHLDENPTVEDCLETLDVASRNVKRLMNVVDDLLQLTNECTEDAAECIVLNDLFEEILTELSPLYADKRLKIACTIELENVTGNRTLIQRAFFNLLENAMKYSMEGGEITICARDGTVTISDQGVGIPETDLDKVFEPFYRVDQSRSRKIGGAGLGLSIVKAIIEKHHWTIQAQSTLGEGTVMTVTVAPSGQEI